MPCSLKLLPLSLSYFDGPVSQTFGSRNSSNAISANGAHKLDGKKKLPDRRFGPT